MHSKLQPYGVFWMFGIFNFCAIFYMYFFVPETRGLPDAEKKRQFYPGEKWGRKLRDGETEFAGKTPMQDTRRMQGISDTVISSMSGGGSHK